MHLKRIILQPANYPTNDQYPFNLELFRVTDSIEFTKPVVFFVGENGSGKSTLLRAIATKCGIHIWEGMERTRAHYNRYEKDLHKYISAEWVDKPVPGSFFASEIFRNFAVNLDEWASMSPATLEYFGGKSLLEQSHGQCHMSFFKNRFQIKGLYLLDEPENALSPKRQIELLQLLDQMGRLGHAQFIIATHSPILLALQGSEIFSFDRAPIHTIDYEDTDHYRIYKSFINDRKSMFEGLK
ncbi:MAG: AAA family ATPase [Spirochaetes bacterium]|nr:AAA family ATPase [Spirochaetota bacterium]